MAKRAGLTLSEGLIALAIVVVIAVIVFPIFAVPHRHPYRGSCLGNIKQIGLAAVQYEQDYEDTYPNSHFAPVKIGAAPPTAFPAQTESPVSVWVEQLNPYLKNYVAFHCPSDMAKGRTGGSALKPGEYATSYAMNRWTAFVLKTKAVKHPDEFILFAERNNATRKPNESYLFAPWQWNRKKSDSSMAQDLALTRHANGSIVGFADGHTKWRRANQMTEARNGGAFQPH